ncbi:MAG: NUDIX domain-containing protein [Clostridiales bacterium]|nr:NUDIX domain-containing protein [Clostridiales bacterium]
MVMLRPMTAVYITRGSQILLLYRIGSRVVADSYTGSAGGHMEADEFRSPRDCVLRELREETGLTEDDLQGLILRYVTLRQKGGEIRQNYYYFAELKNCATVHDSTEGRLEWHDIHALDGLPMPVTARHVIDHYLAVGRFDHKLYGEITTADGPVFAALDDF